MKRPGAALLALIMGLVACAGEKEGGGGAAPGGGATGLAGVAGGASGGTGGALHSAGGRATGAVPTAGSGTASSLGGASVGMGGARSGGVGPSGGAGAVPSSAGDSTGGVSPDDGGVMDASGASGDGRGGVGQSSGGRAPSTGGSVTGGSSPGGTAGTGGVSNHDGAPAAGNTDVAVSGGGGGAPPDAGSSGGSDSAQGGNSGSAQAGAGGEAPSGLSWPIDCVPEDTCVGLGAPDIDGDGIAHDCSAAPYAGHQGTDIGISWEQMDAGIPVRAAADGEVFFATDGKYDRCPNEGEPDCQRPVEDLPGGRSGTDVCTEYGPYCGTGTDSCFWCFAGGNVIVILHDGVRGVFATRYDHLRQGSVRVSPGDRVVRGQVIAEVGSAGASTGPHLHFEVWGTGYYELADPWAGRCGPNLGPSLWANEPPWE